MYGELFAAITKMADLPDGNELHLDRVAAERAIAVLSFIKEHTRVSAPKLMNQDNEAVVFTWNFGDLKRYLTVAEDEVDVMFLHKPRQFRCEEVLTHGGELDYPKLMKSIDPEPKSSSTIEG